MPDIKDFAPQLSVMLAELDKRAAVALLHEKYLDAKAPVPRAVESARLTKAYTVLMPMSNAPWAAAAVDSKLDRLEVGGIRTGDKDADTRLWRGVWKQNELSAESKLGFHGTLTNGRAFATVWPDETGEVEVVFDGADQVVVMYQSGRHRARHRVAALRRWTDEFERVNLTLYRADGIYGFRQAREQVDSDARVSAAGLWWEQREMRDADGVMVWPLPNPFEVVPVVELLTHRRLAAGVFPYAHGQFQHHTGILDRINLLTFLGLVVAVWMGFPLRGVVGDKILRDDDGNALPPFRSAPDEVVQFENPDAKLVEYKAADRGNLSIFGELQEFAYSTKTPAHYVPMSTGLSNISADMIRALEGGMHAEVDGIHKPFIGGGLEELVRVGGLMLPDGAIDVPREADVLWLDKQARSLAEAADAATKLKDILPNVFIAEKYLGLTQEELGRVRTEAAGSALDRLFDTMNEDAPETSVAVTG